MLATLAILTLLAAASVRGQEASQSFTMVRSEHSLPGILVRSTFMTTGDFDHDGKQDLLIAPTDLLFLRGRGDGTFHPPVTVQTAPALQDGSPIGDFNGDRNLDLIGRDTVYWGNGDGTFRTATADPLLSTISPSFVAFNLGANRINSVVADFNEDGISDVAGGDSSGYSVLLSNGDGSFRTGLSIAGRRTAALVKDMNLDGHADLVLQSSLVNQPAHFSVLLGDGRGSFRQAPNLGFPLTALFTMLDDFNGDRVPDFLISSVNPWGTFLNLGNPDGTFQSPQHLGLYFAAETVGDLNSDGCRDVVGRVDGWLHLLIGKCDGSFPTVIRLGPNGKTIAADWNGDGRLDLAVNQGNTMCIYLNTVLRPGEVTVSDAESSADGTLRLAPGSLASLHGAGYSTKTEGAPALTNALGDIRLRIVDASGQARSADLLYVSPNQINFRIPEATTLGASTIELSNVQDAAAKYVTVGRANVSASAPTVFRCWAGNSLIATAEADNGLAEPTNVCGDVRFFFPARITFYGTGFVGATIENTRVMVLNQPVVPEYVGPAGGVPGLDKIVIRLERNPTDDGDSYGSWISIIVNGTVAGKGYTPVY